MSPRPRTARFASVLGIAALALVAAACGSDSDGAASTAAPAASAAPATDAPVATDAPAATDASAATDAAAAPVLPDTITIGYQQIPNGDLVVKNQGWLEEAYGPDVTVEWKLFDSGGSVNEAVLAGGVDIGLVGSSPASRGISSEIPYQVDWIFDVIGEAEALAVKPDITSIADLKGKTIATPFASTSHYSLLAALQDAGLSDTDVNIIDAEPDAIFAAWQTGDIDGAYVWNPNLAKLVADGANVLITSADLAKEGKTTYDLGVVTDDFAEQYPDAVTIWATQQDRAVKLLQDDPAAASEAIATELNITPEEALDQANDLIFLTADEQTGADYLGGGLSTNLYAAAKFNLDLGRIDAIQPEEAYTSGVNATFAAAVGKG